MAELTYRCRCCLQTFSRTLMAGEEVEVPPSDTFVCADCRQAASMRMRQVGDSFSLRGRSLDTWRGRRGR